MTCEQRKKSKLSCRIGRLIGNRIYFLSQSKAALFRQSFLKHLLDFASFKYSSFFLVKCVKSELCKI